MRLRHGGLGGVMDFSGFQARLESSTTIGPLVSYLFIETKVLKEKEKLDAC